MQKSSDKIEQMVRDIARVTPLGYEQVRRLVYAGLSEPEIVWMCRVYGGYLNRWVDELHTLADRIGIDIRQAKAKAVFESLERIADRYRR